MEYNSDSYTPSLRRVVFRLEDGRRKYATHHGEILEWEMCDIKALRENISRIGQPIYSPDFSYYACSFADYRNKFKRGTFIRIVGFYTEKLCDPIDPTAII